MDTCMYVLMNIWCALSRQHIVVKSLWWYGRIHINLYVCILTKYVWYIHTSMCIFLYIYKSPHLWIYVCMYSWIFGVLFPDSSLHLCPCDSVVVYTYIYMHDVTIYILCMSTSKYTLIYIYIHHDIYDHDCNIYIYIWLFGMLYLDAHCGCVPFSVCSYIHTSIYIL